MADIQTDLLKFNLGEIDINFRKNQLILNQINDLNTLICKNPDNSIDLNKQKESLITTKIVSSKD